MDTVKVEQNVGLFLAEGWKRAKAEEYGCPVVFKEQYSLAGNVLSQSKVFVSENVTPKSLDNTVRGPIMPAQPIIEPIDPA